MPLLELWNANKAAFSNLNIEQIVAMAGDGNLKDDSPCSTELREYFQLLPLERLADHVERCLTYAFTAGGLVLQDLVNEVGRRLDYTVTNGRYRGVTGQIGFDGIWKSPEGQSIVIETKTTDAYRIKLDTIAAYRTSLTTKGQLGTSSSILIVVGRTDTGELEAQVRGSRHAWDVRIISFDALLKLASWEAMSYRAIAKKAGVASGYVQTILPLAFLAPVLTRELLDGRRQVRGALMVWLRRGISGDWGQQAAWL